MFILLGLGLSHTWYLLHRNSPKCKERFLSLYSFDNKIKMKGWQTKPYTYIKAQKCEKQICCINSCWQISVVLRSHEKSEELIYKMFLWVFRGCSDIQVLCHKAFHLITPSWVLTLVDRQHFITSLTERSCVMNIFKRIALSWFCSRNYRNQEFHNVY